MLFAYCSRYFIGKNGPGSDLVPGPSFLCRINISFTLTANAVLMVAKLAFLKSYVLLY